MQKHEGAGFKQRFARVAHSERHRVHGGGLNAGSLLGKHKSFHILQREI